MDEEKFRKLVLDVIEASLDAQLKAIRKLRGKPEKDKPTKKRMSQVDMVYDILVRAEGALHVSDIIERVETFHGLRMERESIVSALAKKISKGDRFVRAGKNTYDLRTRTAAARKE